MTIHNPPAWLQTPANLNGDVVGYSANDDRLVIAGLLLSGGVTSESAYNVTQTTTPSLTLNVSGGHAYVFGTVTPDQGVYHVYNDASITVSIDPGSSVNPRRDIIALVVRDSEAEGAINRAAVEVIKGTPASSPVDPALPNNAIALARVAVATNAQSVSNSNITNNIRPIARFNDSMQSTPAGFIGSFAGATAPAGWLICDGSTVSRTTYSRLFAAIGTTYGAGNGTTTFALPNLRGRVPVGRDTVQTEFDTLGEQGGSKTHTLTVDEMPSHTHTQEPHKHNQRVTLDTATSAAGIRDTVVGGGPTWTTQDPNQIQLATAVNLPTGGGQPHNNLQPYITLNYIIKT